MNKLVILFCISGCTYDKKDFDFNTKDLRPVSSFKEGDTIYFEGPSGDLDTIMIYKIDSIQKRSWGAFMAPAAENHLFVAIKHLPNHILWTYTVTEGSTFDTKVYYQNLITVTKRPQTKEVSYSIAFKDFSASNGKNGTLGAIRKDTVIVNRKNITNFYEIESDQPQSKSDLGCMETIYWTDNEGLMAYKNKRGDWWTKISKR
ncbi:hypothetical protein [Desertivirga brevis]|uniref:hypothetical protein n=1 Tax=Desertivirga brevis TaxID=2810310 RepID=UPI001A974CDA|nr:hypothetical protein [Pedobacter sp. SYSU D00873]